MEQDFSGKAENKREGAASDHCTKPGQDIGGLSTDSRSSWCDCFKKGAVGKHNHLGSDSLRDLRDYNGASREKPAR